MTSVEFDSILVVDQRLLAFVLIAVEDSQMVEVVELIAVLAEHFLDKSLKLLDEHFLPVAAHRMSEPHWARELLKLTIIEDFPVVAGNFPSEQNCRLEEFSMCKAVGVVGAVEALREPVKVAASKLKNQHAKRGLRKWAHLGRRKLKTEI